MQNVGLRHVSATAARGQVGSPRRGDRPGKNHLRTSRRALPAIHDRRITINCKASVMAGRARQTAKCGPSLVMTLPFRKPCSPQPAALACPRGESSRRPRRKKSREAQDDRMNRIERPFVGWFAHARNPVHPVHPVKTSCLSWLNLCFFVLAHIVWNLSKPGSLADSSTPTFD
jgi:hypothetical protein